jgi:AcrR family transcriptional regulator
LTKPRKLDPRVIRTRKLLLDALLELIPEIGFYNITIQAITERAGLNRATFYLHFTDKDELLSAAIKDVLAELENISIPRESNQKVMDLDGSKDLFIHLFEHVAKHSDFYRIMLGERSVASFAAQMQDYIEQMGLRWLAQANINNSRMTIPVEIFISFLGAAYLGVIKWWIQNDMPHSAEYMATQFMELTLMGIHRSLGLQTSG